MANFAVFTPGPTYTDTGDLSSAGKWISGEEDAVKIGGLVYEYERVPAPGVAGQGTVAFGYRSQKIELKVVYVDTTEAGVIGTWQTDITALANAIGTSLVMGGVTFYAIQLDAAASILGRCRPVGLSSATYFARATVVVEALRLS